MSFDIKGDVKLDELLDMQLHKYEDAVRTIVERYGWGACFPPSLLTLLYFFFYI